MEKYHFSFLFVIFYILGTVSCGKLTFDSSVAYSLINVSQAKTPAFEEIRSFVSFDDLIYTASGSGGILVYRMVGDVMNPVDKLSVTNLYASDLEQVFVRTVEIVQTPSATNLIFSFDTVKGGGIGIAEISSSYTKPLGVLQANPGFRIRNTVTSYLPNGKFQVVLADEQQGILTYELSVLSNSFFEQPKIASLVDFISSQESVDIPTFFSILEAPSASKVTNIAQITNIESLISLAINDEEVFNNLITNIPFLSPNTKSQLQAIVNIPDKTVLSNLLSLSKNYKNDPNIQNLFNNPEISRFLISQQQNLNAPLSGLISNLTLQNSFFDTTDETITPKRLLTLEETDTLYAESYLSNALIFSGGKIDTDTLHDPTYNPFTNITTIGNAREEIEKTIQAVGRKFFADQNNMIKDRFYQLSGQDLEMLFQSVLQQANVIINLIPSLNNAGVNITELFNLFQEKQYYKIIDYLDTSVLAEILRVLPKFQIQTTFQLQSTNAIIPNIRNMYADEYFFYVAAGGDGFYIVDRLTDKIVSSFKKPFSDVSMIIPYELYKKKYYVVADKLDGFIMYRRNRDNKIGEQVARLSLVGDSFSVYPYENILWVADGINGVLGVRVNPDETVVIESEYYQKEGIAYYIGAARRREVLVSYGADGLKMFRLTNILTKQEELRGSVSDPNAVNSTDGKTFADRTLDWYRYSQIAQFLKTFFFNI